MNSTQLLILLVVVVTVFVDLWAIVAAARRPALAFADAGKSKTWWLLVLVVSIFVCNVGFLVSLWYLFMVDPEVRQVAQVGHIGFPTGSGNFPD